MNRSSFALFVALLIHLLLLLLFWLLGTIEVDKKKSVLPQENKIKVSLKEMPLKKKESGLTDKKIKQPEIAPPMPKGSQLEKLVKKPLVKLEPKQKSVKPKLNSKPEVTAPKNESKPKVEPLPPQKPYIPLLDPKMDTNLTKKEPKKEDKKSTDPLYAMLSQDKSTEEEKREITDIPTGASAGGDVKKLYGSQWGKLTPGQQKYMLDNQEIMRRITQTVLTRVARVNLKNDLNVNRSNVIEFYLHPNGDMTDFRFLEKSGYYILDDTTKETIEYAYSQYPTPKEKILVRYNVFYHLAKY